MSDVISVLDYLSMCVNHENEVHGGHRDEDPLGGADILHLELSGTVQSDGNSLCGYVVLERFNKEYRDEVWICLAFCY